MYVYNTNTASTLQPDPWQPVLHPPQKVPGKRTRMYSPLPSLAGVATWINGEPDLADLVGRPVLVYFWSSSCRFCHEAMPMVAQWERDLSGPQGLAVISLYHPRCAAERDITTLVHTVKSMQMTYPCAFDDEGVLMERFRNLYVPAFYLFDHGHGLRHFQAGGKLDRIELALKRVLAREASGSCAYPPSATINHRPVNSQRSDCEDTCWDALSYDEDQCQADWDRCTEFAETDEDRKACDDAHQSCCQTASQYYSSCLKGCADLPDD